jgi:sarcosine oxidase
VTGAFDVIVAGLGAAGSATLRELARRGHRVLGLDRFAPPHDRGSSHGRSRIIREAYFEEPRYVPLVRRAYEGWTALEAERGVTLFHRTGGLTAGPADGELVRGALASARAHGIAHELLDADGIRARVPAFAPGDGVAGVWEHRAGWLAPEAAIAAALDSARAHGASVRTGEPLLAWRADARGVEVTVPSGRVAAGALVLAVGAWTGRVLAELGLPLAVRRNVQLWFAPRTPAAFAPDRFPVLLHEHAPGRAWYGIPDAGDGVKLALHDFGVPADPDAPDRTVTAGDEAAVRALIRRYLPDADGPLRAASVCPYTVTPDGHFILDRHPAHDRVVVASPCSGHGFKFAPALGEALADLATGRPPAMDIAPFRLARLAGTRTP